MKTLKYQKGFLEFLTAVGPFAAAAGSFFGGKAANEANIDQAQISSAFNAEEAQKNRDFQRQMSNTAHQREIKDLRKAGLNPILSARTGGASTPGGAQGTAVTPTIKDIATPAIGAGIQVASAKAQVKNIEATTEKTQEETEILKEQRKPKLNLLTLDVSTAQKIFDTVLPEQMTQAKQKTILNALEKIERDIKIDSDREKYKQLRTKLIEAQTKEEFYRLLGKNIHLLATAGKAATIAGTLFAIWKTFSPPAMAGKLVTPLLKNARKSDFGKSMRRHTDNLKNFSKKYSRKFFEQ